jgi:hypothetical protein
MGQIRVVALRFRLEAGQGVSFANAPPLEVNWRLFEGMLENDMLILKPKAQYESVDVARAEATPMIRAWEIAAGVRYSSPTEFRLVYTGADVVDESDSTVIVTDRLRFQDECHVAATQRSRFPEPPTNPSVTLEIEAIWARVSRYLSGEEPLLSAAYFCFTVLKQGSKSLDEAAQRYRIRSSVLNTLSKLSSIRGDELTARKMLTQMTPLTAEEAQWVRTALLAITGHLLNLTPQSPWLEQPGP